MAPALRMTRSIQETQPFFCKISAGGSSGLGLWDDGTLLLCIFCDWICWVRVWRIRERGVTGGFGVAYFEIYHMRIQYKESLRVKCLVYHVRE
jgi:hypothetical protein